MSADPYNSVPENAEELAKLQSGLRGIADDESMLSEVGMAMRSLLSGNGDSEDRIRAMLKEEFAAGHLREETYELVQTLLGKIVTEELVRSPLPASASVGNELFGATAVIEEQAQAQEAVKALVQPVSESQPAPASPLATEAPSVPEIPLQVGSVLRDRFLLKESVSEGSMGVVYKAMDRRLAETGDEEVCVAIKVLTPELSRNVAALRALQQEAAKGRCLNHPNIVRFIDLDREGDRYFIVMEWLEGRSLSSILDDDPGKGLDFNTAMDIIRQTARALDYAHQRGVVHADVKPGNIIITPTGEVKLIDFGVARIRQKENAGKSRFGPSILRAGSPAYSSMQVLTGEDPVPADDVFSLACLMYRLIAGYRVFGPRNAAHAAEDGMDPKQPQGLADEQWQPLKKALSYSRVTRFDSAVAFVKALGITTGNSAPSESSAIAYLAPPQQTAELPPPQIQLEQVPTPTIGQGSLMGAPIRAEQESIMYDPVDDDDDEQRRSPWRLMVFGIITIGAAVFVVTQTELVDQIGAKVESIDISPLSNAFNSEPEITDVPRVDDTMQHIAGLETGTESSEPLAAATDEPGVTDGDVDATIADGSVIAGSDTLIPDALLDDSVPVVATIDYSTLPTATLTINLGSDSSEPVVTDLIIREDGESAIVDIFREDVAEAQSFVIKETAFSGNQSPWQTGQYSIEDDGQVFFAAGQDRARLTISVPSNSVREPDREVVLQIHDEANPDLNLARINLSLVDDDQRAFERGLPLNTVGFAVNQVSVREFDPAVQITIIRYNPDNRAMEVGYVLQDVTATEGQDYFWPRSTIIYFAAGQRSVRILIPLGQDARPEPDEAFIMELETDSASPDSNLFSQITVIIRDDDS